MAKLYTIDNKLLTETPELRILDKVYAVDDRTKTVEKAQQIMDNDDIDQSDMMKKLLSLALGAKAAKEIEDANYPFAGYLSIFTKTVAAMLGEDEDEIEQRFQNSKKDNI